MLNTFEILPIRTVDRNHVEVGTQPVAVGVGVREQAALKLFE